jgi:hypothetical protein
MMLAAILIAHLCTSYAFFPSSSRFGSTRSSVRSTQKSSALHAADPDKNLFGSKLMPDYTEQELSELFQEFNITNFDINNDPELIKWAPSKEFFELYGFKNNTERYKRKTMNVKMDFYSSYTKPILPQYKTFIADIMSMAFIQSVDARYKYDALHAFGLCTQYYTIMKGYALQEEVNFTYITYYFFKSQKSYLTLKFSCYHFRST